MSYETKEIKQGIKLHLIDTKKYKTNLITVVMALPLTRESVTFNTIIPAVLKRGTKNLKTQDEISKKLEEMYGAEFDCGIEKIGDNHILKFYIETLNDNYIPEENSKENLTKASLDLLLDIILNPYIEENCFKNEYVEQEKNNIKLLIESKIDNKDSYALNRCIEEMYKGRPYGLYKYGYIEDLQKINSKALYEYYLNVIKTAKIDIFFSGNINKEEILKYINQNDNINKLEDREGKILISIENSIKEETKKIEEKMDITQGKLVIGLDVESNGPDSKFPISIYNVILRRKCNIKIISKC